MLEKHIQSKIIKQLEAAGWYVIKLIQTNKNGIPDLIATRNGMVVYIEVKQPGEDPGPLQKFRHKEIRNTGTTVIVATSTNDTAHLCKRF